MIEPSAADTVGVSRETELTLWGCQGPVVVAEAFGVYVGMMYRAERPEAAWKLSVDFYDWRARMDRDWQGLLFHCYFNAFIPPQNLR